jgi:hypothetical protein
MRNLGMILATAILAMAVVGCGSEGDGISEQNKKVMSDTNALAKKVDGNFDKLTDTEKEAFLKLAHGDEKQARALCNLMAHPPNEAFKNRMPGPRGPGGGSNPNPGG